MAKKAEKRTAGEPAVNTGSGNFAIVTDSASDITREIALKYNISIVPIYIHLDGKEFRDGIDIDSNRIYELQQKEKAIFSTSAPSPHDFIEVYKRLLKKHKKIFSIHISSNLSAVIKSALIARDLLDAGERIEIFDSLSGTMGTGLMVIAAARAAGKGYSFQKILRILSFLRENIRLYGTIDTLKYLRRSGRVPAITSFISRLLLIKLLLGINNGVVGMIGISFTRYGSLLEITRRVIRDFRKERWVMVSVIHTLGFGQSREILKKLQVPLNIVYSTVTKCTPAVGAHTGPGLIGIIVSKLDREIADLFV
ncbi:DegV domain-containing protein [subsurface metagenome]